MYHFYMAQYRQHEDLIYREFCREFNIPEDTNLASWDLDKKWEEWMIEYGLNEHKYQMDKRINAMSFPSKSYSAAELVKELKKETNRLSQNNPIIGSEINELWFNSMINNLQDAIDELKDLPYPNYLNTWHWKKIRAAML